MAVGETAELMSDLSEEQANTFALVLTSYGLPYTVRREPGGWKIQVPAADFDRAVRLIESYLSENPRLTEDRNDQSPSVGTGRTFSGVWVSLSLLALHLARQSISDPDGLLRKTGASAEAILSGEFFRTATALTLHGDVLHLAGNILGIAVFATAVCNSTGAGLGWLLILVAGMTGNLANAWLFGSDHLSIGASTAVFGSVGILAAVQFHHKRQAGESRFRSWLPLAGGLALLAFLGSGAHADITAHLFGFLAGSMLGLFYAVHIRRPPGRKTQRWLAALAAGTMALSWLAVL